MASVSSMSSEGGSSSFTGQGLFREVCRPQAQPLCPTGWAGANSQSRTHCPLALGGWWLLLPGPSSWRPLGMLALPPWGSAAVCPRRVIPPRCYSNPHYREMSSRSNPTASRSGSAARGEMGHLSAADWGSRLDGWQGMRKRWGAVLCCVNFLSPPCPPAAGCHPSREPSAQSLLSGVPVLC